MNKNIFNNFLIAKSYRTCTHLFQKLPSLAPTPAPAPAPESRNAPMLHRLLHHRGPFKGEGGGLLAKVGKEFCPFCLLLLRAQSHTCAWTLQYIFLSHTVKDH